MTTQFEHLTPGAYKMPVLPAQEWNLTKKITDIIAPRRHVLLIGMGLGLAVMASLLMWAVRLGYSGEWRYLFVPWNLLLAILPVGFAAAAYMTRRWWLFGLFGGLWLLFLPNAPYLITDLVHLRPYSDVPVWYDALMLFTLSLTGVLLGLASLAMMQAAVRRRADTAVSWLFVLFTLGLSGLGVYIGRFLRWNSWDLLVRPFTLLADLADHFSKPQALFSAGVMSFTLMVMLFASYAMMTALGSFIVDRQNS